MQWLRENDLSWVNSFHFIRRRGTWYNRGVRKWYELDGFVMNLQDRKHVVKNIKAVGTSLSDHNAVCIGLCIRIYSERLQEITGGNMYLN